jgi:ABC-type sugar transport system substrate-binding protein
MAAEILSTLMKGKTAVVFSGDTASPIHRELVSAFRSEADKRGAITAEVFDTADNPLKADEMIKTALSRYEDLSGIYISSANSLPVIEHVVRSGKAGIIKIVTSDVFPGLAGYIKDGTVSATIFQDPEGQARAAFDNLYYHIAEDRQYSGQLMITPQIVIKSNLGLYLSGEEGGS